MEELIIYNVNWTSYNAGPSPEGNRRSEIFLGGCKAALEGHPCKGCFNPKLWEFSGVAKTTPEAAAANIMKYAPNKYITFVGGEPLDQIRPLSKTCEILHNAGYHIIVFTHYTSNDIVLKDVFEDNSSYNVLFHNIDILIDGAYDETQRIYDDTLMDGLHDIGSANQVIWDVREWLLGGTTIINGLKAGDLAGLCVDDNESLHYITKENEAAYDICMPIEF